MEDWESLNLRDYSNWKTRWLIIFSIYLHFFSILRTIQNLAVMVLHNPFPKDGG